MEQAILLSVIVPTYNRYKQLPFLIQSLSDQKISRLSSEIIIVDDGSTDSTLQVLKTASQAFGDGWLRILTQSNQGQAIARQYGVSQSRGTFLLFLDDDMILAHSNVLANHISFHRNVAEPTVALGLILAPLGNKFRPAFEYFYERSISAIYRSFENGNQKPGGIHFYSAHVSLSKELFLQAGGFDPSFRQAEDRELGLRLEFVYRAPFFFLNSASAFHHSLTQKYSRFLQRAQLYGHYDLKIAKVYPSHPEIHPNQIFSSKNFYKRWLARASWSLPRTAMIMSKPLIPIAWFLQVLGLRYLAIFCCSTLYCIYYVCGYKQSLLLELKQNTTKGSFHAAA